MGTYGTRFTSLTRYFIASTDFLKITPCSKRPSNHTMILFLSTPPLGGTAATWTATAGQYFFVSQLQQRRRRRQGH